MLKLTEHQIILSKKFINLNNKDNLELLRYYSIQYKIFIRFPCNYITNVLSLAPYGLNIDCIIENLNEENGDLSQKGSNLFLTKNYIILIDMLIKSSLCLTSHSECNSKKKIARFENFFDVLSPFKIF